MPDMGPLSELLIELGTARVGDLHESRAGRIYIHAVTQLEISSTAIREIVAGGGDLCFLMPDSVADTIRKSGCYATKTERD